MSFGGRRDAKNGDGQTVMPLRWTAHALDGLVEREIDPIEVERTLAAPELSVLDPPLRVVLMRRYFDEPLGQAMLLRVVVEETPNERVIVTIDKTSKIEKYLGGAR